MRERNYSELSGTNHFRSDPESSKSSKMFAVLDQLSSKLGLDESTRDEARSIYTRAISIHVARRMRPLTIAAASIYVACKERTIHVGFKQLARVLRSSVSVRSIGRCYRLLVMNLHIPLPDSLTESENYVIKIAQKTGKFEDAVSLALRVLERERNTGDFTTGKDSAGVAAAALYIACMNLGEEATQDELADAAGISPVALRHSAKSLLPMLNVMEQK